MIIKIELANNSQNPKCNPISSTEKDLFQTASITLKKWSYLQKLIRCRNGIITTNDPTHAIDMDSLDFLWKLKLMIYSQLRRLHKPNNPDQHVLCMESGEFSSYFSFLFFFTWREAVLLVHVIDLDIKLVIFSQGLARSHKDKLSMTFCMASVLHFPWGC